MAEEANEQAEAREAEGAEAIAEELSSRPAHMPFMLSEMVGEQPQEDDDSALGEDEVDEAHARIVDAHPFRNLPLKDLFPLLPKCCPCCFGDCICHKKKTNTQIEEELEKADEEDEDLKHQEEVENELLDGILEKFGVTFTGSGPSDKKQEVDESVKKEEKAEGDAADLQGDALNGLGFGFEAYWKMLRRLSATFAVMTLIFIPQLIICNTTAGMYQLRNYANDRFTLGNLGFASANCISQYVSLNESRQISCNPGQITYLYSSGIVPSSYAQPNWNNTYGLSQCTDYDSLTSEAQTCTSQYWMNDTFYDYFVSNCIGNTTCNITLPAFVDPSITKDSMCTYEGDDYQNSTRAFMQYYCVETSEELVNIRIKGLIFTCLGVFAIFCYYISINNLKKMAQIDFKLYDLSSVTTGDFSVEIEIHEDQWNYFKNMIAEIEEPETTHAFPSMWEMERPMVTLGQHLESELCRKLNSLPHVTEESTDLKIAHITFSYNNGKIMKLLVERGIVITKGQYHTLKKINDQIDHYFDNHYEEMYRPVGAFITFETQEGMERSKWHFPEDMKEHMELNPEFEDVVPEDEHNFLGSELQIKAATEPTDIIWENRYTTHGQLVKRSICVGVCIFFVLLGALILFKAMSNTTAINQKRYPPTQNCKEINDMFMNSSGVVDTTENTSPFWQYAYLDKNYTIQTQGSGVYQCYCQTTANMLEFAKAGSFGICTPFVADEGGGYFLTEVLTVLITVVNIIITVICIFLIKRIQFHTVTVETAAIMSLIFIGTFFNTAILLILTSANTEYSILKWIPLRGSYTDLDQNWYIDMGDALVWTLLVNALNPYISITISFLMVTLLRSIDMGFGNYCCCRHSKQTRQKTIQGYVNLYSGPPHQMYTMYGLALNTCWTTLMYGMSLPILFPIAMLTFVNIYLCERLGIAYWYTKPPEYDADLNDLAIKYLFWAPMLFLVFGYWSIGNKQMFNNEVYPLTEPTMPIKTGHSGLPWTDDGPSMAFFFMFLLYSCVLCCGSCIKACLTKYHLNQQEHEEEVDEALGNFFECIPELRRKDWLATEVSNANRLGIKTMGLGVFEQMRTIVGKRRVLKNTPSYEILMNPTYQTMFQYVPIMQRDDPREISTSEFVTMCLSYPFRRKMEEEKAGVIPTPTGSNFAYLNDGMVPIMGDPRKRQAALERQRNAVAAAVVVEDTPVAINDDAPAGDEDKLIEPVAETEAAMAIDLSVRPNLQKPINFSDDHPAEGGYFGRFLGFSKFRRNMAANANYHTAVARAEEQKKQE